MLTPYGIPMQLPSPSRFFVYHTRGHAVLEYRQGYGQTWSATGIWHRVNYLGRPCDIKRLNRRSSDPPVDHNRCFGRHSSRSVAKHCNNSLGDVIGVADGGSFRDVGIAAKGSSPFTTTSNSSRFFQKHSDLIDPLTVSMRVPQAPDKGTQISLSRSDAQTGHETLHKPYPNPDTGLGGHSAVEQKMMTPLQHRTTLESRKKPQKREAIAAGN
ncbi:hypothetical protein B0I37DRAFT_143153 [Chaetomium sp. MPI-CAGE-AT-0009]|nr:hypothetical protein B0I37DRAFT_143153 [Chaetomium sp. MPI-CAGE-AT-0009]